LADATLYASRGFTTNVVATVDRKRKYSGFPAL
jgi:hypothetical protein